MFINASGNNETFEHRIEQLNNLLYRILNEVEQRIVVMPGPSGEFSLKNGTLIIICIRHAD